MMTTTGSILATSLATAAVGVGAVARQLRRRNLHKWVGAHFRKEAVRRLRRGRPSVNGLDVFICIADHFEPHAGGATDAVADARVRAWVERYGELLGGFRDSGGRPPRHTFFYPIDQYVPHHVDALAKLGQDGYCEIEIHLHHDHDTADNLDTTLRRFRDIFASRHGLLGRRASDGQAMYGFVHGNWALDNSRPDGRRCGVDNELAVLQKTGCYADFTLPSAPDVTQTRKINSIYYAVGRPGRCRSHEHGLDVGTAAAPENGLMIIQGPLRLCRTPGRWALRIENGCLQKSQPPSPDRLEQWLRAEVGVAGRPDWRFIKLHTHGAIEANRDVLLGRPMLDFHRALAQRAAADSGFRFHYVTAREMYNLVKAAEAGWAGPINAARDFEIMPSPSHAEHAAKIALPEFCSRSLRTPQSDPMESVEVTCLSDSNCRH
jgi:hypothetical protein